MRYIKIFILTFQHVFEYRGRVFVWFLMSLLNPLLLLLFWGGLTQGSRSITSGWNISIIVSYYLLLALLDSVLMCHIEEDISREDIQKGNIVMYLIKPISYYWKKFLEEFPYRILQGLFAFIAVVVVIFFIKTFAITSSPVILFLAIISSILGLFLSFTIKLIMGLISIWIIEVQGLYQFYDILNFVFGGYVVPLFLLPKQVAYFAYALPFSYVVYTPLAIFQGRLSLPQVFLSMLGQIFWLTLFLLLCKFTLRKGLKQFTGAGG